MIALFVRYVAHKCTWTGTGRSLSSGAVAAADRPGTGGLQAADLTCGSTNGELGAGADAVLVTVWGTNRRRVGEAAIANWVADALDSWNPGG